MGTHKNKSEIAWLVTLLLERGKSYSARAIDDLIRESIRAELLHNPQFAPDHIRLAMIENGLIERDAAGTSYRVHSSVLLPHENERVYQELIEKSRIVSSSSERICCPVCDAAFPPAVVVGHFLRKHRLAGLWESLMDTYAQ